MDPCPQRQVEGLLAVLDEDVVVAGAAVRHLGAVGRVADAARPVVVVATGRQDMCDAHATPESDLRQ